MLPDDALGPTPVLTGRALRLVPLEPRHAAGLHACVRDPENRRLTGSHGDFAYESLVAWCASRADQRGRYDWAVELLDGTFAGDAAVNAFDAASASAGYRIALAPDHHGKGYGTEVTGLVLSHLFETVGVHRVELEVYAFNPRAERVYAKNGFVREGVRREALYWDGEWVDAVVMGVLRAEWLASRDRSPDADGPAPQRGAGPSAAVLSRGSE